MSENDKNGFELWLKLLSPILAVGAFLWGIYTYQDTSIKKLAAQIAEAERLEITRRIEATRPYLDKQLKLFTEATKVASTISISKDDVEISNARKRFEALYWGELALVERGNVASAMINFRSALVAKKEQSELRGFALALAHACRDELAESWNTDAWKR